MTTIQDLQPCWSRWRDGLDSAIYATDGALVQRKSEVHSPYYVTTQWSKGPPIKIWYVSPCDFNVLRASAHTIEPMHVREPGFYDKACLRA